MYPYAYLVWCGIFALIWFFLYWARRDTRRQMLLMSIFCTPLGPISESYHVLDYWRPETITHTLVGPEDFIIAFLIGGISAVLYEYLFANGRERRERPGMLLFIFVCYAFGSGFLFFAAQLGLSSVQSTLTLLAVCALVPVTLRPWLLRNSFLSGVAFMTFMVVFYQFFMYLYPGIIDAWWFGASGIRIIGVPVEEIAWAFLWGMVAGPCSELVARLKLPRYIR